MGINGLRQSKAVVQIQLSSFSMSRGGPEIDVLVTRRFRKVHQRIHHHSTPAVATVLLFQKEKTQLSRLAPVHKTKKTSPATIHLGGPAPAASGVLLQHFIKFGHSSGHVIFEGTPVAVRSLVSRPVAGNSVAQIARLQVVAQGKLKSRPTVLLDTQQVTNRTKMSRQFGFFRR